MTIKDSIGCDECGNDPCVCNDIGIDKDFELTVRVKMRAPTMIKAATVLRRILDCYVSAGYVQSHSIEAGELHIAENRP